MKNTSAKSAWLTGRRPTLARDLTLVLIVKVTLLYAAWYLWFSHPQAPHMQMPGAAVASHVLGQSGTPLAFRPPAPPGSTAEPARSAP